MTRGKYFYSWQGHPVFRFFASLHLAMILLITLIIAVAIGTIYESQFDAKVAQAYIYDASWFNVWLLLLCANLAVVAFSRMPWKKRHIGFLLTHLGIITILVGALVGKIFGVEGTITIFGDQPPASRLMINQKVVRVQRGTGTQLIFPFNMVHRKPTKDRPDYLGKTGNDWKLSVVDYAEAMEQKTEARASTSGVPALQVKLHTNMMGQTMEQWLLLDGEKGNQFDLGLALIDFTREPAKSTAPVKVVEQKVLETVFAFSKTPGEQIGRIKEGVTSGAKIQLFADKGTYRVAFNIDGKPFLYPLETLQKGPVAIPGTKLTVKLENFWNDFKLQDNQPVNASSEPNNPAVLVTLSGLTRNTPTTETKFEPQTPNWARVKLGNDGKLYYQIMSRKNGEVKGEVKVGEPIVTGWADWTLTVASYLPLAEKETRFLPLPANAPPMQKAKAPDGVKLQVSNGVKTVEEWVAAGWEVEFPTGAEPLRTTFGFKGAILPMGLQLEKFEVERNEGTDSPAGFKSTLKITTPEGQQLSAQCWMNNPANYPDTIFHTFTGMTYKIAQASWNPENLNQTTLQIIQDPGWLLKWVGSLILCCGIFTLFYLKPGSKKNQALTEPEVPGQV